MQRLRYDWRLAVRLIGALALVFVAFAHRVPPTSDALPDAAAYAFPDGSIPVICVSSPGDEGQQRPGHALPCDACLVSASVLLSHPRDIALPASGSFEAGLPIATASRRRSSAWPPAAPPTAPPRA